jgi:hypothetical protein
VTLGEARRPPSRGRCRSASGPVACAAPTGRRPPRRGGGCAAGRRRRSPRRARELGVAVYGGPMIATRSPSSSTSAIRCDESRTMMPWSQAAGSARMSRIPAGSRPVVGSSSKHQPRRVGRPGDADALAHAVRVVADLVLAAIGETCRSASYWRSTIRPCPATDAHRAERAVNVEKADVRARQAGEPAGSAQVERQSPLDGRDTTGARRAPAPVERDRVDLDHTRALGRLDRESVGVDRAVGHIVGRELEHRPATRDPRRRRRAGRRRPPAARPKAASRS